MFGANRLNDVIAGTILVCQPRELLVAVPVKLDHPLIELFRKCASVRWQLIAVKMPEAIPQNSLSVTAPEQAAFRQLDRLRRQTPDNFSDPHDLSLTLRRAV
jgi:hypothetical protein